MGDIAWIILQLKDKIFLSLVCEDVVGTEKSDLFRWQPHCAYSLVLFL